MRVSTGFAREIPDVPAWPTAGAASSSRSFDHLVGERKQPVWDSEAERLRGLCADDQFEFSRLQNRQVGRLLALGDAAGVNADLAKQVRNIGSIAHQTAGRRELAIRGNRRHC